MDYNNYKGKSPQEDEGVVSLAGEWARRGRTPMQGSYDPTMVPRSSIRIAGPSTVRRTTPHVATNEPTQANFAQCQNMRRQVASMYGPVPAQNTQSYTPPQAPHTAGLKPSYATVASNGQQSRYQPRLNYASSAPDQNPQHPTRTRPQPSAFSARPAPSNPFQYQLEQGRSYAQVAAAPTGQPLPQNPMPAGNQMLSPTQMMYPNQAYNGSYNPTLFGELTSAQTYSRTPSASTPYDYNSPDLSEPLFGAYPNDAPRVNAFGFDPNTDFNLFDTSIDRYLCGEEPYVAKTTLVIDPAATPSPSQSLQSPVNSLDASSATSSIRRTKREIMGGTSGEHKCRHCGGGFRSSDDRRHHERRVHMPQSGRPFQCLQCDQRFLHQKDLTRHLPVHDDRAANAKYFCDYADCKYTTDGFARKDHYHRHMAAHHRADSGVQMSRSTSAGTYQ